MYDTRTSIPGTRHRKEVDLERVIPFMEEKTESSRVLQVGGVPGSSADASIVELEEYIVASRTTMPCDILMLADHD